MLYTLSWAYSQSRTYFEHGLKHRAILSLETKEMLKVTIETNAEWRPGQHIYLRFLTQGVHALTAHPFTICSLATGSSNGRNEMVFYVRTRSGLTGRLGRLADKSPGISVPVLLDGPYGGVSSRWFDGFDHTVVIGGGAGAGFTLALARYFILAQRQLTPSRQGKMTLVVSSRDPGLRLWYLEALAAAIAEEKEDSADAIHSYGLTVRIHETGGPVETSSAHGSETDDRPKNKGEAVSRSHDLEGVETGIFSGRPDLFTLGQDAMAAAEGASIGFVVCGPGSMVHDVGQMAASAQASVAKGRSGPSEVWFHKESFS